MVSYAFTGGGYAGDKLKEHLKVFGNWTIEIVSASTRWRVTLSISYRGR